MHSLASHALKRLSKRQIQPTSHQADLCQDPPRWVPATQVHGEGIFITFDESMIRKLEEIDAVTARNVPAAGHRGWHNSRKLDSDEAYQGIRMRCSTSH